MVRCSQKDMFPIDFHAPGARSDSVSSRWPLHISSCCYFPSQKLESQLRRFEFEFCHGARLESDLNVTGGENVDIFLAKI